MRRKRQFALVMCGALAMGADGPAPNATIPPLNTTAPGILRGKVSIATNALFYTPDLSGVVVYVQSHPQLDAEPLPAVRSVMSQRNKAFSTDLLIIPRGCDVEFPNWDRFSHNVFSRSAAAPPFDLDRYPYGQSKSYHFPKVGAVQIFCNIHPSMKSVIYVTPNRYFARADAQGRFELPPLPEGEYEIVTWNLRCAPQSQKVQITSGQVTEVKFALHESGRLTAGHSPRRRAEGYGSVERGLGVKREVLNLPVVAESHAALPSGAAAETAPSATQPQPE